jgi:NADH-quinone oxidoreductase subunit D
MHPALEESVYFKVHVDGEEIKDLEINLGYEHKGVEKSFENREWKKNLFLASRICGICNHEHASAYAQGVEKLLNIKVPQRALYIRTIMTELERIQNHLLWAGIAAHEIGFETLFMYCWKSREHALDSVEAISGKRVHYDVNSIGGVRRDISKENSQRVLANLEKIEHALPRYSKVFLKDRSVVARTKGVGILKKWTAEEFSIVGPTARASGIDYDIRKVEPYQAFADMDFKVILDHKADTQARTRVRLLELEQSIKIIRQALETLPDGDWKGKPAPMLVPAGETYSRVEAPRGELFYYIKSDGGKMPSRVKVRTPTYSNFTVLKEMMLGETIADAPIIIASIDPCISCTDRLEVFDVNKNKSKIYSTHELTKMKEVNY